MVSLSLRIFVAILAFLAYVVAPITFVWGWTRWRQLRRSRTLSAKLSLTGFILASASGLVAIVMIGYALTHGFGSFFSDSGACGERIHCVGTLRFLP
jgi:hypothetical protein